MQRKLSQRQSLQLNQQNNYNLFIEYIKSDSFEFGFFCIVSFMRKKVLIISYYWPPAGGVGVLRNLKFVKYLRNFGWEPIVFAPKNADYPQLDNNNFDDIPKDIELIRYPIIEPFALFRKFTGRKDSDKTNPVYVRNNNAGFLDKFAVWTRGNFFIPDARFLWIKPSVKYLSKYIAENKIDAILTDGPPHTNTVIGQKLSAKFNIPWLADFQDPWTQVDYYKMMNIGARADRKHKKLEQDSFKTAKKITIASPTWAGELESIGAKDVDVIYYGYDEADFENLQVETKADEFVISHAGVLGIDRKPDTLLKVLSDICKENSDFKQKLRIKFAGAVDYSIVEMLKKNGLTDNFIELGNILRVDALKLMLSSDLLFLPVNKADNAKGRLPGKIYEYLRAKKPILSLGVKGSDVEQILTDTQSGFNFEYDDYQAIKSYILSIFNHDFKIKPDSSEIERFSSENQTKQLAMYLDKIL